MNNTNKPRTEWSYLTNFLSIIGQTSIFLVFLLSTQMYAQQETNSGNFGIHAGLNSGILSGGIGPSFSFHYAFRTEKVLQLESMLFFDSHSGETFLTGESQENYGFGVAAGTRINIKPQENWNPSFVIMPGVIYSSETTSTNVDARSGLSGTVCIAFSNSFYKKHMISLGLNQGKYITAAYLKYGLWF